MFKFFVWTVIAVINSMAIHVVVVEQEAFVFTGQPMDLLQARMTAFVMILAVASAGLVRRFTTPDHITAVMIGTIFTLIVLGTFTWTIGRFPHLSYLIVVGFGYALAFAIIMTGSDEQSRRRTIP